MSPFRLLVLAAAALSLSACGAAQRLPFVPGGERAEPEPLMPILGHRIVSGDILVVRVPSSGCTVRVDIEVQVTRRGDRRELTFRRVRDDYCDAHEPQGTELGFGFEELGVRSADQIVIMNPVIGR
ncbi:MAG: hypothetical protein KIS81_03825 [Maricaulaceae bacterium]|nr:hypothetical protein [Maricaulaceae bacterium]